MRKLYFANLQVLVEGGVHILGCLGRRIAGIAFVVVKKWHVDTILQQIGPAALADRNNAKIFQLFKSLP